MRALLPALLALAVAGCAAPPRNWSRPGSTEQDLFTDRGQCRAQALSISNVTVQQATLVFDACMEGKGWRSSTPS